MVYTELERGKKGRITGWEGIEKGPAVLESAEDEKDESSISESDIEYFKKRRNYWHTKKKQRDPLQIQINKYAEEHNLCLD